MYTREKDALALDVFLTMHRHHAGGCALVDARGYLAGNISVSDFKHIGSHGESLPLLLKPAVDFIKSVNIAAR
jgi:CBS domain-containing protein